MDTKARAGIAAIAAVATVVTVALGFSLLSAGAGTKSHPPDPWAGLSDAQKQAMVDQAHAMNVKYLQDFEARHGDPRSLPVITIDTFQGPPASFGSAAARATVVLEGVVGAVHFAAGPDGGLPRMTASVDVLRVGRGAVTGSAVLVRQPGGPVAQPDGRGALVRLAGEELILPGDHVVLLLTRPQPGVDLYRPVDGAGVYFVRNGVLAGEAAIRYGLAGQRVATAWGTMSSRQLPDTDLPLQGGQADSS